MKKNKELVYLEIAHIRKVELPSDGEKRLYYLLRGYNGEKMVLDWLIKFGSETWEIIGDYWFDNGKRLQADFIVITKDTWYVLEVKNYDGDFQYLDYDCVLNGKLLKDNIVTKMQERINRLTHMASEIPHSVNVTGAMIFINEHSQVSLDTKVNYDVVLRHQLRSYIKNIKDKSDFPLKASYLKDCHEVLNRYRVANPFQPESLQVESFSGIPKGITCCQCHSFNMIAKHQSIECRKCGVRETKAKAILRAAYHLIILYFDNPQMLTPRNIYDFMGGMIGITSIKKIMNKHYEKVGGINKYYYKMHV